MRDAREIHVVFLPSWYPADPQDISGSFFREQALALRHIGIKVGVIAPSLRSMKRPLSALRGAGRIYCEDDHGIPTYRSYLPHLTPRLQTITSRRLSKRALRLFDEYIKAQGRPDLLHVHAALPAGEAAIAIMARHRIPFVLSEHSTALARGRVGSRGVRQMREVNRMASACYAVSSPFAKLLESRLGLEPNACGVMPNSVSDLFLSGEIQSKNSAGFQFCHVSLLDGKKNVAALIRAFASRFRGDATVSLVIGGNGPTRPALQQLARDCGVSRQVEFVGALSRGQVRDLLARSDAFVLPSQFETFGVVLVEATAMGVPIIATRCGGPEDIVTDRNGILVPVGDTAALGAAMQRMREDRACWDPQRIRRECRDRFSAEVLTRQWRDIYAALVSRQDTPT